MVVFRKRSGARGGTLYDASVSIGQAFWPYTTGCFSAPAKRRRGRACPPLTKSHTRSGRRVASSSFHEDSSLIHDGCPRGFRKDAPNGREPGRPVACFGCCPPALGGLQCHSRSSVSLRRVGLRVPARPARSRSALGFTFHSVPNGFAGFAFCWGSLG